jgi:hypothetical protein
MQMLDVDTGMGMGVGGVFFFKIRKQTCRYVACVYVIYICICICTLHLVPACLCQSWRMFMRARMCVRMRVTVCSLHCRLQSEQN